MAIPSFERRLIQVYLILADFFGLYFSFLVAQMIRFESTDVIAYTQALFAGGRFAVVFFILGLCQYIFDLYEPRHWRSSIFSPLKIIFSSGTTALLLFAYFYFVASATGGVYGRGVLLGSLTGFTVISLSVRYIVDRLYNTKSENLSWLFIGNSNSQAILKKDWARLRLRGRVDWFTPLVAADMASATTAGQQSLASQMRDERQAIIVDGSLSDSDAKILMKARLRGRMVLSLQNFYEFYCGKVPLHTLDDSWFALAEGFSILHSQVSIRLKRLTDILISILLIFILLPVFVLLYVLIRLESKGPALYSQVRVGAGGATFVMWKFRSMCMDAENEGAQWAQKNDNRMTHIGRWIRKFRLDEIPQLWNILKGDMSFIGPRPERPEFTRDLSQKIPFFEFRLLVKPGLTGWAQVMYPYGATEEDALEKLQFDLFYIKNYSFARDIEIILKTVSVVLFGAGR